MIRSSHEVVTKRKVSIPSFLSCPPSIAHTLSHWIMRYIVQDGFCPWFRGGCTACSRGRDEFQCGEDVFPSNQAQRTIETMQLPFFLANPVFWLILASMVFETALSLVLVCTHFGTLALAGCKVDPLPSGAPWATSLTAKWSTNLA